jgi:hypothetical protein
VESLDDIGLLKNPLKLDNDRSKYKTPKDSRQSTIYQPPKVSGNHTSNSNSNSNSNNLTPKRSVGKFSKSKPHSKANSPNQLRQQLLDLLRTPEPKQ